MSVTAHLTEQFVLKREFPWLNLKWLIIASYIPDGWGLSKVLLFATGATEVHREILFGWLHSLPLTAVLAALVYVYFGKRAGVSFLIGAWLHVLTDSFDTIGVKLLYPFSNLKFSLGLWPWTDGPLWTDLVAYYTSPVSLTVECVFLCWAIFAILRSSNVPGFLNKIRFLWSSESWRG